RHRRGYRRHHPSWHRARYPPGGGPTGHASREDQDLPRTLRVRDLHGIIPGSPLIVRRLLLANFRNYAELDLTVPAGRLFFVGDNAQGKSNLLEAVALLSTARSPRAGGDTEMVGRLAEDGSQPIAR